MGIEIVLPDGNRSLEISRDAALALADELIALGDDATAHLLFLTAHSAPREGVKIDGDNAQSIARALDHLRNAREADAENIGNDVGLNDLRDGVLARMARSPLTYRLRSWEFDGEDKTFFSYTGPYAKGDRLVAAPDAVLTVATVELEATPVVDGVLVVQRTSEQ